MTTTTNSGTALIPPDAARQSLATGTAGTALLHLERALIGIGSWSTARTHIQQTVRGPIDSGEHTGLYYGLPALAFVLHHAAAADLRYRRAAASLDTHLVRLARRQLKAATTRIQHGKAATFGEYDLFHGLTGIALLLMQRMPDDPVLVDVLRHLVRLTEPRDLNGVELPGWWVDHDPDPLLPTPGGHANLGMAHGAAGILATLALALRHGHTVNHHTDAIDRLTDWFDRWRRHDPDHGTWWPQWLSHDELATGRSNQPAPGRPSWCYGAPGITRALHLAAIAANSPDRRADAEHLLAACLDDHHVQRLTEPGLCHGLAGLYQTAFRAAADTHNPAITQRLPALATALQRAANTVGSEADGGLLTGHTGLQLAALTARHGTPRTRWDTCLLIT